MLKLIIGLQFIKFMLYLSILVFVFTGFGERNELGAIYVFPGPQQHVTDCVDWQCKKDDGYCHK
jgi:hypothetical protein